MFTAKGLVAAGFNNEGNNGNARRSTGVVIGWNRVHGDDEHDFRAGKEKRDGCGEGAVRKSR